MTTLASFRNMFSNACFGFTAKAAARIVNNDGLDSMEKLREYDASRSKELAKVVRNTDAPGGGGTKLTVSEPACHNLALGGRVANDFAKMSRTLVCADMFNVFTDPDLLEVHNMQKLLERDHDNIPALEFL